MENFLED